MLSRLTTQVFVEALDRCFANVCELDLIFHFDEVHTLLSCMIIGGYVCDTNLDSIAASFRAVRALALSLTDAADQSGQDHLGQRGQPDGAIQRRGRELAVAGAAGVARAIMTCNVRKLYSS